MPLLTKFETYLSGLPNGLDSYPSYTSKNSTLRVFIDKTKLPVVPPELPDVIAEMIRNPPLASTWVRGVWWNVAHCALRDIAYQTDDAFLTALRRSNESLLSTPLYRTLLLVATPKMLLARAGQVWGMFVRGIPLSVEEITDGRATLRLLFGSGAISSLNMKAAVYSHIFLLEQAGAKDVSSSVTYDELGARIFHKWS